MKTADGYIVNQCLNGDWSAFGMLVDKYKASMYALAYQKLHDFNDAEDVTQEAFILAYRKLHTLKRYDNFFAWLYSITSNLCKKVLLKRAEDSEIEYVEDQSSETLNSLSMNAYREEEAYKSVHEALDSLPNIYQQVLMLYYLGGMCGEEMAQFLSISHDTVRQRLSRARAQLKEEVLAMMGAYFEQKKLQASFTFRIIEMVKRININPINVSKSLPWGISLATGIIFTILSFSPNIINLGKIGNFIYSALLTETKVLRIGEIPMDVIKISKIPFLSSQQGNENCGNQKMLTNQNAFFMAPQMQGDTWTKKADIPTPRNELTTCDSGNKIYAIGGSSNFGYTPATEEYDPETDEWIKKANMPTVRGGIVSCAVNGKIYVMGGYGQGQPIEFSIVEEYDPKSDKWERKADMPTGRQFFSTNAVNGRIYAIGGWRGGAAISVVEEYDPEKDIWTVKTSMPDTRFGFSASVVNGKIYVIGGYPIGGFPIGGGGDFLSTVEEYDPATDTWTKKADMSTARMWLSASAINDKIYVIGGWAGGPGLALSIVEEYDPAADKWTRKADALTPRQRFSSSAVNGKVYAIGGDGNGQLILPIEEYDTGFAGEGKNITPKKKLPMTWGKIKQKNI